MLSLLKNNKLFDIPEAYQMGFQDPASNIMEGLINFHHDIMTYLAFIATFVLWFLVRIVYHFNDSNIRVKTINHNTLLEVVWTVIPALILVTIGLPSFALLYAMDELRSPAMTLKVVGHQWYWFYEYPKVSASIDKFELESHMEPTGLVGKFRLADVTAAIKLPTKINVKILVTSADVLHSWAVPSLGIKMDACPGRLNQLWTNIKRAGVYYGQCSEICGVNHAFMPIVVIGTRLHDFYNWHLLNMKNNLD